jgi:uncharacterized protein (TIGR02145 family)
MAENLRTRLYNDGTEIRFDKSGSSTGGVSQTWSGTGLNYGAYTLYAHDSVATPSSNLINYGYLYNWYAVKGIITDGGTSTKNICPTGWHVPTDTDWTDLTNFIGTNPGTKLKKYSSLWLTNTGSDNYGFSALPGGYRNNDGSFGGIRNIAFFWSATESSSSFAWSRKLDYFSSGVDRANSYLYKSVAVSVRCLRD